LIEVRMIMMMISTAITLNECCGLIEAFALIRRIAFFAFQPIILAFMSILPIFFLLFQTSLPIFTRLIRHLMIVGMILAP
jgi:hypothetical protein